MSQLLDAIDGVPNACEPIHGIVTGGQPTLEHLAALKRAGCEVVIDLREPMEPQPFRPAAVTKAGLEYRNIPVGHGTLADATFARRSEEHTSELQSPCNLVCRLLLEKKKKRLQD